MSSPEPNRLLTAIMQLPLLLVLHFFFSSLSPSLASTVVTHLPGFQGPLPFYLETGYVNVDEENGSEYFYYFIKSERNPEEDPVILWLTGGPRCSAFSGLVFEIGPLRFVKSEYSGDLPNLVYHPYGWTKFSNIIFQDSPAGSGFSFSRHPEGYDEGDVSWSKRAHKFLIKWFEDHPMFLTNPLYIGGDSYGGKAVPLIAQEVSNGLEDGIKPVLNLKGYLVGNPTTGSIFDANYRPLSAHGFGIISTQFFEKIERLCHGQDHRFPSTAECASCLDAFEEVTSEIDMMHVLDPSCPDYSPKPKYPIRGRSMLVDQAMKLYDPPVPPPFACRTYNHFLSYHWANNDAVRRALNIKQGTVLEWQRCNHNLPYNADVHSNLIYHLNLTTKGYRALVYSGDHDLYYPFLGTHGWIRSFNFSIVNDWRSWHVDGQVAGYTITYSNNLTFATVKNGGHSTPEYKPKECFAMFKKWISHKPL